MAVPKSKGGPGATGAHEVWFGGAWRLLVLSLVFHSVYLSSIFDIYFKSPVTEGVAHRFRVARDGAVGVDEVGHALAKRVVLIVGDGLRADKLFQTYPNPPFLNDDPLPLPIPDAPHYVLDDGRTTPAPFVRSLIQSGQAEWGVSHTRVPTESRPGHVALIAGMYEDVSAVTRGWQANPVSFDSVFNQSSHTYSFGSPDILPMFQHGATPGKVDSWSYSEEEEDFSKDAVELDLWVLDHVNQLFTNATTQPDLDTQLRQDGTVLFLHLLGLDTTGHSYRPHGPEYHRNIRVVDHVIEQTAKAVHSFYGDDDTAFVFTADHGMSSKGNHGDGEPDNTRTPLVVWGAGVGAGEEVSTGHDDYSSGWGLNGPRRDVEQADVAVLMSVLGGVPIPANSAGKIPIEYLSASPEFKAKAAFANAQQILAEFEAKSDDKEAHALSFQPYLGLVDSAEGTQSPASHRKTIEDLIAAGKNREAQHHSIDLVETGLEGLRYFQTYDWLILQSIVTLGYLGFIAYSTNFILRTYVFALPPTASSAFGTIPAAGFATFGALATRFALERAPPSYYLYAIFPAYFWSDVLRDVTAFSRLVQAARMRPVVRLTGQAGLVVGALQLLVRGYQRREVFAGLLALMGTLWPLVGMSEDFRRANVKLVVSWVLACGVLSVFPALPVEKGESLPVILAGGLSFVGLAAIGVSFLERGGSVTATAAAGETKIVVSPTLKTTKSLIALEMVLTAAMGVITRGSVTSLQAKQGLPLFNQVAGWLIFVSSLAIPFVRGRPRDQPFFERLLVILCSFCPAFIILSLSYEALFFAAFSVTLCLWMFLECELAEANGGQAAEGQAAAIGGDHVRIGLFFLIFLHVAFFGVGNVASISSFYLEPVFRLIPVFAPFPMAVLLLFKILCPFVALSAVSSVLGRRLRLPTFSLFILALTLSEVLTLNHFFNVTDQGSWLEIGSTITNFAICSLLSIFNTALFLGGEAVLAHTRV